jgi:hypothetical protein
MKDQTRRQREVAVVLMAAVAGEATPAELAQLNDWIRRDPALAAYVVELMGQEYWLTWQGGGVADGSPHCEAAERIAQILQTPRESSGEAVARIPSAALQADRNAAKRLATPASRSTNTAASLSRRWPTQFSVAAALLIGIGALFGALATRWFAPPMASEPMLAIGVAPPADASSGYVARFVQGTACRWNTESPQALNAQSALGAGESLNLLEGLAELQFDWTTGAANIKLEGPAVLILTAERGANLTRGKMTADVQLADGAFALGTPNGQVEVSQDASIGVVVRGEDVELHVFHGAATLITPWANSGRNGRLLVSAGEAMKIVNDDDGRVQLKKCRAHPQMFASQISMRSDKLLVSPEYVREILRGKPSLYWRFEGESPDVIRNEAGDQRHGRLVGSVQWIGQQDNGNVDFGAGLSAEELHAYIVSDEPVTDDFSDDYSIEMWIKPSHYHWGTVASLVGDPPQPGWQNVHGMLFELGGPIAYPSAIEQPGRVRFLHRSPPSDDFAKGTSCFSGKPYVLRQWQHVAAVKEGSQMRLYVDGELVASGEDASSLPPGLRLLVGQLDQNRDNRRFIGQIDELAVYPRALSDQEIRRRYELLRAPLKRTDAS